MVRGLGGGGGPIRRAGGMGCRRVLHGATTSHAICSPRAAAGAAPVARCLGERRLAFKTRLQIYTVGGYISNMRKDIKASCAKRINRIEGQVRGIARMVADDRYCIDIVTQISAVRAALRRLEEEILRDHVGHCVEHAIASGNKADQRRKIEELMNVVGRAER